MILQRFLNFTIAQVLIKCRMMRRRDCTLFRASRMITLLLPRWVMGSGRLKGLRDFISWRPRVALRYAPRYTQRLRFASSLRYSALLRVTRYVFFFPPHLLPGPLALFFFKSSSACCLVNSLGSSFLEIDAFVFPSVTYGP